MGDAVHLALRPCSSCPCSAVCPLCPPPVHQQHFSTGEAGGSPLAPGRGWGEFGLEHRILALSVVTCAVFMARPCQHVGGCSRSSCSPPWVQVPCPVWELGLWPQHKGRMGMESSFVSQLQLNSVT